MSRTADALNGSRGGWVVAIVYSSLLFGFGQFFKGPTGVFDSTVSGLILAGAYLVTRRICGLRFGHMGFLTLLLWPRRILDDLLAATL